MERGGRGGVEEYKRRTQERSSGFNAKVNSPGVGVGRAEIVEVDGEQDCKMLLKKKKKKKQSSNRKKGQL